MKSKAILYSYTAPLNNDAEGKLRPGFRVGNTVFVLTHTRPFLTGFIEMPASSVESEHFHSKGEKIFLTFALNEQTKKYNNKPGGTITLSPEALEFIEAMESSCKEYLIIETNSGPDEVRE